MTNWSVIYLVKKKETSSVDEYGDLVIEEEFDKRYAEVKSIGQKEFYQAQTIGLNLEIKFVLASSRDYSNEKEVVYNNVRYKVLKTYVTQNDGIEITCYGGVRENVSTENSH